ncbi:MAG TPA: pirin family protein [Myxococcota bacterium]|nr:pirin family protein [Myxococcota bacterium]
MLNVRKATDRGHAQHGWLDSFHTFSFADYYDPQHMGFRALRVINEDRVQPAQGFGRHSHRDMEIVTYVIEGALAHQDSLGNGSVIRPGDVQRMSAGRGISHSEYNHSESELVYFLQIWLLPEQAGLPPSYEQKHFAQSERAGRLRLVASRDGRDGSVRVHQDVALYAGLLAPGEKASLALAAGRHAWVQVVRGALTLDGTALAAGDGAALSDAPRLEVVAREPSELLVFDLA